MTGVVLSEDDKQRGPCTACEVSWAACRAAGGACCEECVRFYGATHERAEQVAS